MKNAQKIKRKTFLHEQNNRLKMHSKIFKLKKQKDECSWIMIKKLTCLLNNVNELSWCRAAKKRVEKVQRKKNIAFLNSIFEFSQFSKLNKTKYISQFIAWVFSEKRVRNKSTSILKNYVYIQFIWVSLCFCFGQRFAGCFVHWLKVMKNKREK